MVGAKVRGANAAIRRFPAPVVDLRFLELSPQPSPASSVQHGLPQHAGILVCPRCRGCLEFHVDTLECKWCGSEYLSESGIPRLFFPHDVLFGPRDVTHKVKSFYDENPFPAYAETDSRESLIERSSRSSLARLLDAQLPAGALILDAGCGTGQLANFLALQKKRQVIGADLSLAPLSFAKRFKDRCAIHNAGFLQMNLFRPPFAERVFDVVIANSVLHYTSDPLQGFRSLASLLKPDGLFVVTLYNPLGRLGNDLRRLFYRLSNDKLALLRWRNPIQRARFVQRYRQPCESRHSLREIAYDWFEANGFEFVYCAPRIGSRRLSGGDDLRYGRWPGDRGMQFQTELGMMLRGLVNDGLFVMIGRNKAQPKRLEAGQALAAHA
jgi:SAM-dependent methyltransferase